MVFLNDEGARLNEPSGCLFIFVISDCNVASLVVDIARRQVIWDEGRSLRAGGGLAIAVNDLDNWFAERPFKQMRPGNVVVFARAVMFMSNRPFCGL